MEDIEKLYGELLELGYKPQEARAILPNCLETEMYITGIKIDWIRMLKKRTAPDAHPQMQALWKGIIV
jgi:thymidylate synthase (FAD)